MARIVEWSSAWELGESGMFQTYTLYVLFQHLWSSPGIEEHKPRVIYDDFFPADGDCVEFLPPKIPPSGMGNSRTASSPPFALSLHSRAISSSNPISRIPISSSNLSIHLPVCSCSFNSPLLSFANSRVAAPALWPAVISSIESPTCVTINCCHINSSNRIKHTIIKPSPPSSNSHALAICRIPAGSGFGGLNSRVTMGANVFPGRKVCSKCITGPLDTP